MGNRLQRFQLEHDPVRRRRDLRKPVLQRLRVRHRDDDLPATERRQGHLLDDAFHQHQLVQRRRAGTEPRAIQQLCRSGGQQLFCPQLRRRTALERELVERNRESRRFYEPGRHDLVEVATADAGHPKQRDSLGFDPGTSHRRLQDRRRRSAQCRLALHPNDGCLFRWPHRARNAERLLHRISQGDFQRPRRERNSFRAQRLHRHRRIPGRLAGRQPAELHADKRAAERHHGGRLRGDERIFHLGTRHRRLPKREFRNQPRRSFHALDAIRRLHARSCRCIGK